MYIWQHFANPLAKAFRKTSNNKGTVQSFCPFCVCDHVSGPIQRIPFQLGMVNSSFMYLVKEDEVELATPYQLDYNGELRGTVWETNANTGPDWGPAGT